MSVKFQVHYDVVNDVHLMRATKPYGDGKIAGFDIPINGDIPTEYDKGFAERQLDDYIAKQERG